MITLSVAKEKKEKKKSASDGGWRVRTHRGPSRMLVAPWTPLVCLLTLLRTQRRTPACVPACMRVCAARFLCARARRPLHNLWMAFLRRRGALCGAREGEGRELWRKRGKKEVIKGGQEEHLGRRYLCACRCVRACVCVCLCARLPVDFTRVSSPCGARPSLPGAFMIFTHGSRANGRCVMGSNWLWKSRFFDWMNYSV